jgi:hypothetical protein
LTGWSGGGGGPTGGGEGGEGGGAGGGGGPGGGGGDGTGHAPDAMYVHAVCGVVKLYWHPAEMRTVTPGVVDEFPLHPSIPETPRRDAGVVSPGFCCMMTRFTKGPLTTLESPAVVRRNWFPAMVRFTIVWMLEKEVRSCMAVLYSLRLSTWSRLAALGTDRIPPAGPAVPTAAPELSVMPPSTAKSFVCWSFGRKEGLISTGTLSEDCSSTDPAAEALCPHY